MDALKQRILRGEHKLVLELWSEHQMTIVMVTHDLSEAFHLGTRVIAVDKHRHDPHAPHRYGSVITSDFEAKPRLARALQRAERAAG